jgi:hypothetical protein
VIVNGSKVDEGALPWATCTGHLLKVFVMPRNLSDILLNRGSVAHYDCPAPTFSLPGSLPWLQDTSSIALQWRLCQLSMGSHLDLDHNGLDGGPDHWQKLFLNPAKYPWTCVYKVGSI